MAVWRVRLEADDLNTVTLMDRSASAQENQFLQSFDFASPAVREVVDDQVGDGVDDQSTYVGAAALSVELKMMGQVELLLAALRPFLSPRRRPRFVVWDDTWAQERRLVLRGVSWPGDRSGIQDRLRDSQFQWTVPAGVWEAAAITTYTIAAATGGGDGRTYDLVTPRTYPATSVAGVAYVTNMGDLPAPFVARLYGPAIGPRLTNDDTGQMVAFTSELVLSAGEFVEIDTYAQTAYLSGSTDSSVLPMLDFDTTTWWHLPTGVTSVRYNPVAGVVVGAVAEIEYRQRWL
jgi:hypothetical protein